MFQTLWPGTISKNYGDSDSQQRPFSQGSNFFLERWQKVHKQMREKEHMESK
jgi:hypothetical protein